MRICLHASHSLMVIPTHVSRCLGIFLAGLRYPFLYPFDWAKYGLNVGESPASTLSIELLAAAPQILFDSFAAHLKALPRAVTRTGYALRLLPSPENGRGSS